jgi:penicillin-binding protein 1A
MSSNRNTPPWRDRITAAAGAPPVKRPRMAPMRASTGAWRFWQSPEEETGKRLHQTLPESWKKAVRDGQTVPAWGKAPLLWLLNVPRWIYFTLIALVLVLGGGAIIATVTLYSYLQKPVAIPTPVVGSATETGHIYAADGTLLADLHGPINRQSIPLSQMSPVLKQAVLAAEDANFYKEKALDFRSIIRAGIADYFAGHYAQGGSTITQEYVKIEYLGVANKTLSQKIAEVRLAYQIERRLTKDQILERYLNTVYFGEGAYGVQAASLTYFNKPASQLDLSESALLAGIISSPSGNDPDTNPAGAESRRQYVLNRMQADGFISAGVADTARAGLPTVVPPPTPSTVAYQDPYFVDTIRQYLFQKYGEALVLGGGLNVQTTLQPAQQAEAQAAVAKALPSPGDPDAALVSVDPATGYVTAMYAGKNYATEQFNLATQGRRQPGSAMKPFVLIAALEKGISPLTVYDGPAHICLAGWLPTCEVGTYGGEAYGPITLETATIYSVNTVYAQLIMQVGPQNVVNVANAMGVPGPSWLLPSAAGCRPVGSPACTTHLIAEPSLALGSNDVSPLEMASAYATLADNGVYHAPKFVSKVTDGQGAVLESGPSPAVQVVDPGIVATVDRILHEVVTQGTGVEANLGRPQAGKTGTTQDFNNAWFVGYTPELATSVWIGYQAAAKPLLNIEGVGQVQGGSIPAALWASYMKQALPPATPALISSDSRYMGLVNAPTQQVTTTVVGTNTVTSTVASTDIAATCVLLPSTTVVSPLPSPVTGTLYNVYPYLRCGSGGYASTTPSSTATSAPTSTATPPSTAGTPMPTESFYPVAPDASPSPSPQFIPQPGCLVSLIC